METAKNPSLYLLIIFQLEHGWLNVLAQKPDQR